MSVPLSDDDAVFLLEVGGRAALFAEKLPRIGKRYRAMLVAGPLGPYPLGWTWIPFGTT